ncbi:hypothetical protein OCH239_17705 [Roseivivax halodurans JCM 10272]|uniref:Uracil-DNA glycosylase-like domain-containing protein n=1 Tax=Roseivivax halodurans JCM 10272 TaxID=1449350 RepID=X7EIZ2_9RHOB|nr:uracil-DNA glycosylase family protein [Roseivivax halodurans]ETX15123.1 hypothetical protein OCH239_17705 [Roseivivax halodurans JCM 10272]
MRDARGDMTQLVAARRALPRMAGLTPLAEVGLDVDLVSPYQISCGAPDGPALLSYNFLDAPTARARRAELARAGYLPAMLFNRVLDAALSLAGLARGDIYLTHSCHLLPPARSATVPRAAIDASMDAVTRHELASRPVIALGRAAADACRRFGLPHVALPHPSARGLTAKDKARRLADALLRAHAGPGCRRPAHA